MECVIGLFREKFIIFKGILLIDYFLFNYENFDCYILWVDYMIRVYVVFVSFCFFIIFFD